MVKIVFLGTSEFAVPILERLVKEPAFKILAVVTNPDKPAGRNKTLSPPPVKFLAQKHNIPMFQPYSLKIESLKNSLEIKNLKFKIAEADVCVVASYGKIIPKEYLEIPKFGFVNVHPSLLPKYRGPTPIQTAILNGDKETGITIMKMDEEIDHGPILASREFSIFNFVYSAEAASAAKAGKFSNSKELEEKLAKLGAELLTKTLPDYVSGIIQPTPQNHAKATFTKKFTIEDGKIDWSKSAEEIENKIRALNPEPGTYTNWEDKKIKILRTKVVSGENGIFPGTVKIQNDQLLIKTASDWIGVEELQPEGKNKMDPKTFINGYRKIDGKMLK